MARRRFGVSLSEDLAEALEELTEALGTNRSRLIEEAVKRYVEESVHLLDPHECVAVLAVECGREPYSIMRAGERLGITVTHIHRHGGENCIHLLLVSGDSRELAGLKRDLSRLRGCRSRLMALH